MLCEYAQEKAILTGHDTANFSSTGFRKQIFNFYTLLPYSQCAKGSKIRLSQRLLIYQCNVTVTVNNLCMPLQLPSAQWVCEWRNPHVWQLPALQWGRIGGGTVRAQHARVLQTTVEGDAVWSHDGGCVNGELLPHSGSVYQSCLPAVANSKGFCHMMHLEKDVLVFHSLTLSIRVDVPWLCKNMRHALKQGHL